MVLKVIEVKGDEMEKIIDMLKNTPEILKGLVSEIPKGMLKLHRIPGKWCIHEHAVHIGAVQHMLIERLRRFMDEERPEFAAYIPGTTTDPDELKKMDMRDTLNEFEKTRKEFVGMLKNLTESQWQKEGDHTKYSAFTPYIMARHVLLHDHTHMFRIEELWLVKNFGED